MVDDRDPILQNLFYEAANDLDGEAFIAEVMAKTHGRRYRLLTVGFGAALVLAVIVWLLALPIQEFGVLVSQALTATLIDLGDSWVAWVFAPVNNIASLSILTLKAIRVAWKKIVSASYVY